ncbi:MAG: Ig-like domain-containing protein [Cyclobacteriaceae bacterium]
MKSKSILEFVRKTRILVLVFLSTAAWAQEPPSLHFQTDPTSPEFGRITVSLSEKWVEKLAALQLDQSNFKRMLQVYVGSEIPDDLPAVVGSYQVTPMGLSFYPRFAPPPGISYSVLFRADVLEELLHGPSISDSFNQSKTVKFPDANNKAETLVEGIYPGTNELPSNVLRFYVHFSGPMGYENPYAYLKLYNEMGVEILDPFVEVDQGLWDETRTRLTVLVHPGRVKRGVGPNMTVGPVFEEGKSYKLFIDKEWKDINAQPLLDNYEQTYQIATADRVKVSTALWRVQKPREGTLSPLQIHFGEALDHALARRMISINKADGLLVEGTVSLDPMQLIWLFKPANPWKAGDYRVIINTKLEDLAGNNLIGVFDRPTLSNADDNKAASFKTISFVID